MVHSFLLSGYKTRRDTRASAAWRTLGYGLRRCDRSHEGNAITILEIMELLVASRDRPATQCLTRKQVSRKRYDVRSRASRRMPCDRERKRDAKREKEKDTITRPECGHGEALKRENATA